MGSPELLPMSSPELPCLGSPKHPFPTKKANGRQKAAVSRVYDDEEVADSCEDEHVSDEATLYTREDRSTAKKTTGRRKAAVARFYDDERSADSSEDEHVSDEEDHTKGKKLTAKRQSSKGRAGASNLTDTQWTVIVSFDQTKAARLYANSQTSVRPSTSVWSLPRKRPMKRSIVWLQRHHCLASRFFKQWLTNGNGSRVKDSRTPIST
jgi:ribosomal protein S24E